MQKSTLVLALVALLLASVQEAAGESACAELKDLYYTRAAKIFTVLARAVDFQTRADQEPTKLVPEFAAINQTVFVRGVDFCTVLSLNAELFAPFLSQVDATLTTSYRAINLSDLADLVGSFAAIELKYLLRQSLITTESTNTLIQCLINGLDSFQCGN
jgi:hypothetical protein